MSEMNTTSSPEPSAPVSEATEAPETQAPASEAPASEPSGELILGKYKTQEDLASAYKELETKLRSSREELRNEVLNEINEKSEKPPEAYEIPEGLDPELAETNEQFLGFAKYAKEQGWTQQQFDNAVSFYLASQPQVDIEAERKALGDNVDARLEAVNNFVSTTFTEEEFNLLGPLASTAKGVEVLEKLMGLTQVKVAQGEGNNTAESRDEMLIRAKRMQNDPRYYSQRDRDLSYVKEVDELFRKAVGQG